MKSVRFKGDAMGHVMWWSRNDRKILGKIWNLLEDISRNGAATGIGKPEHLKYRDAWSRRITDEHRLVYNVDEQYLHVISCKGHYE